MDRNALPTTTPAADRGPAGPLEAEAPPPPLYRSEGFAEDLLDGDAAAPADDRSRRWPATWLFAMPLTAALLGALATTLS